MKKSLLFSALLLASSNLWAHAHAGKIDEGMPDAQKIRFCERGRDLALQACFAGERGRPMMRFTEDGSDGPRITNLIIQRIYNEPQISSPKKAETFGRATCNEMMGSPRSEE